MLEKGKISIRQFTIAVILYIVGSAILIVPAILASKAKQDAWIAAIMAVCISLLVIPLYNALGKRFPNMTLAEYSEVIMGRWLGKAIFLSFLTFPFFIATLTLRNIGDFLTTQIMRETPIQAIHIIVMAIVVMSVKLGLETLARAGELFFPWIMLLVIVMVLLVTPQIKVTNLQPVLEEGFLPLVKAAIPFISFPFLGSIIFLMISPSVNRPMKAGKALFSGVLLGGILLTAMTVLAIVVIGPGGTARESFPSYEIARRISIGGFLERIEVVMAVIWFLTIFFRLTVLLYVLVLGVAQTFRFREYQFLAIPLGVVTILFSIFEIPNNTYLITFNQTVWPLYAPTFGLLLPLLLYIVAVLRNASSSVSNDTQMK
ncbi:GerAB/ArcD/ProY family transporter [Paenibacillus cymbidii]|uniref:GerAB/ArcD/ProY family transporter n=1 Tax=Paenibacillus cymbidii TaxID=1639034 RepID=UPI001080543E|nr:endospore germination permease [Paenibacillus cymbidii]